MSKQITEISLPSIESIVRNVRSFEVHPKLEKCLASCSMIPCIDGYFQK